MSASWNRKISGPRSHAWRREPLRAVDRERTSSVPAPPRWRSHPSSSCPCSGLASTVTASTSPSTPTGCAPPSAPVSPRSRCRRSTRSFQITASKTVKSCLRSTGGRSTCPRSPPTSSPATASWPRSGHRVASHARHRVGAVTRDQGTGVDLHDAPQRGRGPGREHPPGRRPPQQHRRRTGRDVLAERHDRPTHGRARLRRRAGVLRRRDRGRRRRREPGRHHDVQRSVLRRLRGRVPQAALDLHLPLPDGPGGDGQLPHRRPEVPQQFEGRRADPHVRTRRRRSRSRSTATRKARPSPRTAARSSPSTRSCRSTSTARGRPVSTRPTSCAKLGAGETRLAESGHTGIDVEYFRVITRPGAEPVRQRFFWRYKMFPNKYLVGKGVPPTTAAPGATTTPTPTPTTAPAPTAPPVAPPAG